MSEIELLFLGTGTSAGVPMIGCHCEVCSSTDPHDHRDRPSVCISYGGKRIIVDTSPELRLQCIRHSINMIDAVVYTHAHADHIMGLDDLRRFNALSNNSLDVWADERTFKALDKCFGYAFEEPDPAIKMFRPRLKKRVIEGPFELEGDIWTPIPLLHGDMPILGFRIGHMAYCTDVSTIPESSFDLLRDLDVAVLDALQHKKHSTHFSLEEAIEAARRIGAKQTLFTHIAHALGHETTNKTLPEGMRLAFDGQRVTARAAGEQ
jgi:phosphoribosyl 1,2-cyclic phosphate phosphodiesterase